MILEGNVYDPEFQEELDKHDVKISMAKFPPQEGPVEDGIVPRAEPNVRTSIRTVKGA